MLERKPVFPHVIEMNYQAGEHLGCNVYLVYDESEWILIDIGFEDAVEEIVEIIRQLDFPLSNCKTLIATHADVDHIQGLAKVKQLLKAPVTGHRLAVQPLAEGDLIKTFARIDAQDIHLDMPPVKIDTLVDNGDIITVGKLKLEVWHTPGHTDSQLSFRMGNLLFTRRQHLSRRLRRGHRCSSRQRHPGVSAFVAAHSGQRCRMAAAKPRPDLPQGQ